MAEAHDRNSPKSDAHQRRLVHFFGRVQGVGFRYTANAIAQRHRVTGYVQNLDDGRVRLEVEGPPNEITGFLTELNETMRRYIDNTTVTATPANGEFSDFGIRRSSD